jgi:hypothetical protein
MVLFLAGKQRLWKAGRDVSNLNNPTVTEKKMKMNQSCVYSRHREDLVTVWMYSDK